MTTCYKQKKREEFDKEFRGVGFNAGVRHLVLSFLDATIDEVMEMKNKELIDLAKKADAVMIALDTHGESIVAHLMDSDENAGERLRRSIKDVLYPESPDNIKNLE